MSNKLSYSFLLLLFLIIQSCSRSIPNVFVITPNSIDATADTQEIPLSINCDLAWSAEMLHGSWAKIASSTPGGADTPGSVVLKLDMNLDYEDRTDSIKVVAGKEVKYVAVKQSGLASILSNQSVTISATTTAAFVINSKMDWIAEKVDTKSTPSWFDISPSSGSAGSTLVKVIPLEENLNVGDRNAFVRVRMAGKFFYVTVTQKQTDALMLSPDKIELSNKESQFTVDLQTNVNYDIAFKDGCSSWLSTVSTKSLNQFSIVFKALANDTDYVRSGVVSISGNGLTEEFTVYQAEKDMLVLDGERQEFGSEGGAFDINLRTNVEYEVIMPGNPSWLHEDASRQSRVDRRSFVVDENDTYNDREAIIRFKDINSSLYQDYIVIQRQKDAMFVDPSEVRLESSEGSFSVTVSSNVKYDVSVSPECRDWLYCASTKALTAEQVVFSYTENKSDDDREGSVVFTSGNMSCELKVLQKGIDFIRLDTHDIVVPFYGGRTDVHVHTNVSSYSVEIEGDPSWISLENQQINVPDLRVFKIQQNESHTSRTARIVFVDAATGTMDVLNVTQESKPDNPLYSTQIPGIYGLDGVDYVLSVNESQASIRYFSNYSTFRLIYPERRLVELSHLPLSFELGGKHSIEVLLWENGRTIRTEYEMYVSQMDDSLVWLESKDGLMFIVYRTDVI